ncbi:glyoxylase-like metal-dependent hydrolase (beta-lactamase superfamily II) [Salibacterium salarium]|uniref:MBL fold metallo-hydrolase n=1 Tax=Salibacterium salarium TaxID=284579 RepID=UPI002780E073|nr:MBL fold metallo-hydrolase [Salibacterium salarium]MDQ0300774.1 glyoxylase-like metal-dependent hydrolase (beta-lactamase superfamily II) [Salibacterium salarium]
MKVKKVSNHIYKIEAWMGIIVSAWIVKTDNGSIIVDTGMGWMTSRILEQAEKYGPLQMILLTHGHIDHTGGLSSILKKETVPVYAHRLEIPYMEGDLIYPRKKKPQYLVDKGVVKKLPEDGEGVLHTMMGLIPYYTPGHSPGHTVFYHPDDNVLICGDLFTSKKGELTPPIKMFTADMKQAVMSGGIVKKRTPDILSICHGKDILNPSKQYEKYRLEYEKS